VTADENPTAGVLPRDAEQPLCPPRRW